MTDWTGKTEEAAAFINAATNQGVTVKVNGQLAKRTFAKPPATVVNGKLLLYVPGSQNRAGGGVLWVTKYGPLEIEVTPREAVI